MQQLTKAEEEIMHIIWKLEKCMVKEIIESLGNEDIPHSTVSSVVRILEKKGFVGYKAYGKTHEYFPLVTKADYAKSGLKKWMSHFFDDSPRQLVSFLVENKQLNLKDIRQIMKDLESLKNIKP